MKKMYTALILVICILVIGLSFSSLLAEDFSFIGINWNDNLNTVREKISQSGLSSDTRWMVLERLSTPLNSIFKNSRVDEEKNRELTHIAEKFKKDLRIEHQLKYIEFRGKKDSIVKSASFFFAYDRDLLLAYAIFLNTSIVKITMGEGGFYQDLIKKYGEPTKTVQWSKVWSRNDQTLYYTVIDDTVILTYVNESNLSSYIARLEGKSKEVDKTIQEKRLGEIGVTY
ncbi:MAG TPA: hypothetical protein VLK23_21855 [Thermodesulfobacteriota bacterium]|nr:hypothetical protein [Thermodesulfobacteriota bacterium]